MAAAARDRPSILQSVPAWLGITTHIVYAWTAVLVENRARFGMPVRG